MYKRQAERAAAEIRKAISIGLGLWLALAGSVYLSWQGWRKARSSELSSGNLAHSIVLLVALSAFVADSKAADRLPAPVAKALQEIAAVCSEVGGQPQMKNALQRADLNGDGTLDYVIDVAGVNCEGAASIYGDREKGVTVFTADANGGVTAAFDDQVYGVRLEHAKSATKLWLTVSGESCGKKAAANLASEAFCERPLAWNAQTGKLRYAPVSMVRMIE